MFHRPVKMWTSLVILCFISAVNSIPLQQDENSSLIVDTKDGLVRGSVLTPLWNRNFTGFLNIPFAEPPVGELRFKSPRPVKPWKGIGNTKEIGTYCPQFYTGFTNDNISRMSEDCLYLNVYIPEVPSKPAEGLSVMVWIFGGGFYTGASTRDAYGPDHLMNKSVIIVTFNYRVGYFGFLSVEHPDVTSNAGMKDQVVALRWVKDNIARFGGNPDDITVFGESAGGISVELLMLSPMAEGLFHRAISQSGTALQIDIDYNNITDAAFFLAEVMGHNATDAGDLVEFLRSVPAEDIYNTQFKIQTQMTGYRAIPASYPVVDFKVQEGSEVFLPEMPEKLMRAGKIHPVSYITGINLKEAKGLENSLTQPILDYYNANPEQLISPYFNVTKGSADSLQIANEMKKLYFGNKNISFDTVSHLVDLQSDVTVYFVQRSTTLHLHYGSKPVYNYIFTYDGTMHYMWGNTTNKGPGHADDIPYLWNMNRFPYNPSGDDMKATGHFTSMWTDFAIHGDPSVHESVKWLPATKTNRYYLDLGVNLTLNQDLFKERMAFWDEEYSSHNK